MLGQQLQNWVRVLIEVNTHANVIHTGCLGRTRKTAKEMLEEVTPNLRRYDTGREDVVPKALSEWV